MTDWCTPKHAAGRRTLSALGSVLAILILTGCATGGGDSQPLAPIHWLLGEWQQDRVDTIRTESWVRVAPGVFRGLGQSIHRDDGVVLFSEGLLLYEIDGAVTYMAHVAENDLPVSFAGTLMTDTQAVFENPAHDFPKRLDYQLLDACNLSVAVSDGADEGFTLRFRRVSESCTRAPADLSSGR